MKRTKDEMDPAEAVEQARAELEEAQAALAALDIHRGTLAEVTSRRRELQDRVEVARERLEVATARADAVEYERIEAEIASLQEQQAEVETAIEQERSRVNDELRKIFLADWLDGTGRFYASPPQGRGLVSMASGVQELEARRAEIVNRIGRLGDRISERRAQRDREAAAARVEARRRLLGGDAVKIALTPWRIIPVGGYVGETVRKLTRRMIPAAIPVDTDREVHVLMPEDSRPWKFLDDGMIERAAPMNPGELCPVMAEVFRRSRG